MIKPLSVWKYYQCNRRKVNVVFAITFLSVLLQYAILVYVTSIINHTWDAQVLGALKSVSIVKLVRPTWEKRNFFIKLLKQQPAVTKVTSYQDSEIAMSLGYGGLLMFLKHPEIKPLMQTLNLHLIQGRPPRPGSN
jgi:ABC-type lipoprotein release transport system permease subunit